MAGGSLGLVSRHGHPMSHHTPARRRLRLSGRLILNRDDANTPYTPTTASYASFPGTVSREAAKKFSTIETRNVK